MSFVELLGPFELLYEEYLEKRESAVIKGDLGFSQPGENSLFSHSSLQLWCKKSKILWFLLVISIISSRLARNFTGMKN